MSISRLFNVVVLAILILVSLSAAPAAAAPTQAPQKGSGSYSYDQISGCYEDKGVNEWSWMITGGGKTVVLDWSDHGVYSTINLCQGGKVTSSVELRTKGHEIVRSNEEQLFKTRGSIIQDGHTYVFSWFWLKGELKMDHFWFDGKKLY